MISHITILTHDMDASVEFYQWLLDLPIQGHYDIQDGEITFLGEEGQTLIELIARDGYEKEGDAEGISIGFEVSSLEEKLDMLMGREVLVTHIISPNPHVRFCYTIDPNGVRIQLVERKQQSSDIKPE